MKNIISVKQWWSEYYKGSPGICKYELDSLSVVPTINRPEFPKAVGLYNENKKSINVSVMDYEFKNITRSTFVVAEALIHEMGHNFLQSDTNMSGQWQKIYGNLTPQ